MTSDSPQVHLRPSRARLEDSQRNSNVVRASVLETALELGLGQSSAVAAWIFNNPLSEELEDHHPESGTQSKPDIKSERVPELAEAATPAFTSDSISASSESSLLNSPANVASNAALTTTRSLSRKPSLIESPHVHFGDFSSDQLQLFSSFSLSPRQVHLGETGDVRPHSRDGSLRRNSGRDNPSPGSADSGYTSEGHYLSKGNAKKGKPGKSKGNKTSRSKVDESKITEKDGDDLSDGGYLSASSNKSQGKSPGGVKSRAMAFFRRRPKKSASDEDDDDSIPPVPALPTLPRPSSPKPLERRAAAASPTRSGFSPLTLSLTSPSSSPPRQPASKSPPPVHTRATQPRRSDHSSSPQRPSSPQVTPVPAVVTSASTAATDPPPPPIPGTPSTAPFTSISGPPTSFGGSGSTPRPLAASSSRQHLNIPPPAPPPTTPLPQPPQFLPASSSEASPPLPAAPTAPSRSGVPARLVSVGPMSPGSTQPLTSRGTASPFRPYLSPRTLPSASHHNGETTSPPECDQFDGNEFTGQQRSGAARSAGLGRTPAFLQRKVQYGPPPSPHPPPDAPLPPSPDPTSSPRPCTPIGSPSKFHEHFSSMPSVPLSQISSISPSLRPSASTATFSESSSVSSLVSVSRSNQGPASRDSRSTAHTSALSESSYGQPVTSAFGRSAMDAGSQFSERSDVSSSVYTRMMVRDSSSVTTYDDDADVEDAIPKSCFDDTDDDASIYPSEDKTAGRRTMYLVEHGGLDENGDEIVVAGSRYWADDEVPPPLPPLPPLPTRPGTGYF